MIGRLIHPRKAERILYGTFFHCWVAVKAQEGVVVGLMMVFLETAIAIKLLAAVWAASTGHHCLAAGQVGEPCKTP